jgi:hypothetical protein
MSENDKQSVLQGARNWYLRLSNRWKTAILIGLVLYWISPFDPPGVFDELILTALLIWFNTGSSTADNSPEEKS